MSTVDLSKLGNIINDGTNGQVLTSQGGSAFSFQDPSGGGGTGVTVHATQSAMLSADASSAVTEGSLHYDTGANKLYVKMADAASGGFYLLASIINASPSISSPSTGTAFTLDGSPNPTTISIVASDSDAGQTLNYYYTVSTGSIGLGTTVTTSATSNGTYASSGNAVAGSSNASTNSHFRINPSNSVATNFSLTFYVTDGTNIANTICSFSLAFAITNSRYTSLLMSANAAGTNSTFTDSSSSGHPITPSGTPLQGAFSPLRESGITQGADVSEYAPANHGGSAYFSGSDYLTSPSHSDFALGTGSFTISAWIRKDAQGSTQTVMGTRTASSDTTGWSIDVTSSNAVQFYTNAAQVAGGTIAANTWYFITVTYDGSSALKLFINGSAVNTGTQAQTLSKQVVVVGAYGSGTQDWQGYISDVRIVKGTATEPSASPTVPLTNVTNTSLLLNFVGSKVFDKSQSSNLTLIGNTTGHATTKFSGAFSTYFDGSDRVDPSDPSQAFPQPNQDWSIEFWCKNIEVVSGSSCFVGWGAGSGSGVTNSTFMIDYTGTKIRNTWQSNDLSSTSDYNLNDGAWRHVAFTFDFSTGVRRIFVGGVLDGSSTSTSGAYTNTENGQIGRSPVYTSRYLKGYLQDFRITRGLCRHVNNGGTYSYPLPTAPLKG